MHSQDAAKSDEWYGHGGILHSRTILKGGPLFDR